MITETMVAQWMAESAVRAGALGAVGALAVLPWRRNAAVRGAVWSAVLAASLLMPVLTAIIPPLFLRTAATVVAQPPAVLLPELPRPAEFAASPSLDSAMDPWQLAGFVYVAVSLLLVVRLAVGLVGGWLLRNRAVELRGLFNGLEVRESAEVASPLTFGWIRPFILLPLEWRTWERRKLDAVLLHEQTHIAHGDFARQTLAALHSAIYWFSPLAWYLRRELAAVAEQTADDRVLAETNDPVFYAEVLVSFAGRRGPLAAAVPMARGGSISATGARIERVLETSRPLTRPLGIAARAGIALAAGAALYGASAASLQTPPAPPSPPAAAPARPATPPPPPPPPPPARPVPPRAAGAPGHQHHHEENLHIAGDHIDYERDGKRYTITDATIVRRARELSGTHQPKLAEEQAKLAAEQAALGARQAALAQSHRQATVETGNLDQELKARLELLRQTARQPKVSQEQLARMQAQLGEVQARVGELQARIGDVQSQQGEAQAKLGEAQARLAERQAKLGEEQARSAEQAHRALRSLIEEAIASGRVKPVN